MRVRSAFGEQARYDAGSERAGALILFFDDLHPEARMNFTTFGRRHRECSLWVGEVEPDGL
jgi:hypothetical protein